MCKLLKKKLFITGGTGLLAINWAFSSSKNYSIVLGLNKRLIELKNIELFNVDFTTLENTILILNKIKPDLVINTVGLSNVDNCEKNKNISKISNEVIPSYLAQACNLHDIPFVHISTDHLFDGSKSLITETETTNPLNEYGKSKARGEKLVEKYFPKSIIVRTNFFGWGPSYRQSFSDFVISNLRNKKKITLFHDIYFTPILMENLIKNIYELIEKNAFGIYNIVSDDRLSKHEFGIKLAKKFNLDLDLIKSGSINGFNNLVLRPRDMSLSNKKISKLLNRSIGTVDHQIDELYNQEKSLQNYQVISLN